MRTLSFTAIAVIAISSSSRIQKVSAFGIGNIGQQVLSRVASPFQSTVSDIAEAVNGDAYQEIVSDDDETLVDTEFLVSDDQLVEQFAPALKFSKYLTMQTKRVPVIIRYSADSGLKPYYLTVAKRVKDAYPDAILSKVILPSESTGGENGDDDLSTFEVLVDGKLVATKNRKSATNSVFVSMGEVDLAITRARRKRRPATVYGEEGTNLRLEMLKKDRKKDGGSK